MRVIIARFAPNVIRHGRMQKRRPSEIVGLGTGDCLCAARVYMERQSILFPGACLMKTRAAVAFEAKKPLEIVEVDLEGPRAGEVLVEIMATGVCHTDRLHARWALTAKAFFPRSLGP